MPIIEKASISRVEGCTPEHPAIEVYTSVYTRKGPRSLWTVGITT